jgi:hypothetical protein
MSHDGLTVSCSGRVRYGHTPSRPNSLKTRLLVQVTLTSSPTLLNYLLIMATYNIPSLARTVVAIPNTSMRGLALWCQLKFK